MYHKKKCSCVGARRSASLSVSRLCSQPLKQLKLAHLNTQRRVRNVISKGDSACDMKLKVCLLGREDELEQQLCDAEREADGVGAVDEDVLGGHDAVDGPQQGVGAPG